MGVGQIGVNIASHLGNVAKSSPDQPAIISAKKDTFEPRTFKELNQDVTGCATYLYSCGIRQGDRVLLAVKPGFQLILIAFSLFYLGAIPVIIDPGMGLTAFLNCIKNTKPNAMVGVKLIHLIRVFFPTSFKSIKKRVLIREKSFIDEINRKFENYVNPASTIENELAAIVFTSGSTGTPKGVSYTHRVFNSQINHLKSDFKIEPGEIDLATLPIFALFNPALSVTSVIPEMNPREPSSADEFKIVKAINEFKITTAFASPVIGKKIYSACKSSNSTLPTIKRLFLAGAPTHPSLIEKLSNIILNGDVIIPYGATEGLPISATNHRDVKILSEDIANGNGSCLGKPLSGNKVCIMPVTNSPFESGVNCPKELPVGEVGEICVSGSVVSKEYYKMPGATVDSKFNNGTFDFHRMGDLGYLDKNGNIRFLGRKVERVHTPSGPIETERCEPLLNGIKNISRSALIGIGHEKIKEPCLVVETEEKTDKKQKQELKNTVSALLKVHLPKFRFAYLVFEKKLPVDSRHNAKIHRLSLAKKWTKKILHNPEQYKLA